MLNEYACYSITYICGLTASTGVLCLFIVGVTEVKRYGRKETGHILRSLFVYSQSMYLYLNYFYI